jgi:hypothetical protein
MALVQLETKLSVYRSPKAAFRARLAEFSQHEIDCMTVKDFEALAFDIRAATGGAGLFDVWEQKLLDHILNDPANTPNATNYIALSSTTPTEAGGSITEPSGGAYARVATTNADWSAASGTAPAVKTNTATITFPAATADWVAGANLTHAVLCATLAGVTTADFIAFGALGTAKPILNGDTASLAAGAIVLEMGDPGDTY